MELCCEYVQRKSELIREHILIEVVTSPVSQSFPAEVPMRTLKLVYYYTYVYSFKIWTSAIGKIISDSDSFQ